jgi:NAD(P)H dehydrogenase (quinone)
VNVYVVYCHPDPDSFTAALRQRVVDELHSAGHAVRVSDLHADGFEPAMSHAEVAAHLDPPEGKAAVAGYSTNLGWCDALVFVYPTWWSGQPAMLTGWFDRVLLRGAAWELPARGTRIRGRLTNVRRIVAITTHGSPRRVNWLEGETGRRVISRSLRVLCHPLARTTWLAMYDIDHSTPQQRAVFLERVGRRMRRL